MGFLTDAPRSTKRMTDVLRDMGQYRYDVADVFRDWVDYATGGLLVHGDKELAARLVAKYGEEYGKLHELTVAWILTLDEQVEDGSWFDALGVVYEYLASNSKRSWLGQFFTPPTLCDLMTDVTSVDVVKGKRVNDPACGSGRMLLSFNQQNPGNRLYGEDIDPMCAKMTALNMAMHGCQGQVTCMDSLAMNDWRFGYEVNPFHRTGGPPVPHLLPLAKEASYSFQRGGIRVREKENPVEPVPSVVTAAAVMGGGQLSLF